MKQLFNELSYSVSKITTKKYSTSFSLGILALKPSIRSAIYAIYGYVRLADEIVDSFHGYNRERLLYRLKKETHNAISEQISLNPILQAFQETVIKYSIDYQLIEKFLHSMEMDLKQVNYNSELYDEYINGSAEVVGLMCLHVFVDGKEDQYLELMPYAMKLGSAFQKINFLRDLKDDYHLLGRTYFPDIDISHFDNIVKAQIEVEIEKEFKEALIGIKRLPTSSRFGVYLAYQYYWALFLKIRGKTSKEILISRVRIPNSKKALVAFTSYLRYKTALL